MSSDRLTELSQTVIAEATQKALTLVAAESCTGGLVMGALTAVAGSSAVVDRGWVTYSNAAKVELLGVEPLLLETYGAVSEPAARAMATGARNGVATRLAVSVTGIAGPGGGTADKPVGLVHFATDGPHGVIHARHVFDGLDRDGVRAAAVKVALKMLLDQIRS